MKTEKYTWKYTKYACTILIRRPGIRYSYTYTRYVRRRRKRETSEELVVMFFSARLIIHGASSIRYQVDMLNLSMYSADTRSLGLKGGTAFVLAAYQIIQDNLETPKEANGGCRRPT